MFGCGGQDGGSRRLECEEADLAVQNIAADDGRPGNLHVPRVRIAHNRCVHDLPTVLLLSYYAVHLREPSQWSVLRGGQLEGVWPPISTSP